MPHHRGAGPDEDAGVINALVYIFAVFPEIAGGSEWSKRMSVDFEGRFEPEEE